MMTHIPDVIFSCEGMKWMNFAILLTRSHLFMWGWKLSRSFPPANNSDFHDLSIFTTKRRFLSFMMTHIRFVTFSCESLKWVNLRYFCRDVIFSCVGGSYEGPLRKRIVVIWAYGFRIFATRRFWASWWRTFPCEGGSHEGPFRKQIIVNWSSRV